MRLSATSSLLCLLHLFTRSALAVYSDEAYHVDYHHALLGIPQARTTFFHRPSASSKASLLYTLSENGIVGARNPKDGAILWRQKLVDQGKNYTSRGHLTAVEGSDTLISALGDKVQAWDAVDGRLGWERQDHGRVKALATVGEGSAGSTLVLTEQEASHAIIRSFSSETGKIQWEYKDSSGDAPHSLISVNGRVFYISLHSALLKGFKLKVTELNPLSGVQKGQIHLFSSESEVSSEESVLFTGGIGGLPVIIWSDKASKFVRVASILKKQVTTLGALSSDGQVLEEIVVEALGAQGRAHFLLQLQGGNSHWAKVYHIDQTTETTAKAYDLPSVSGKGSFSASVHGLDTYFVRHSASKILLFSSASANALQSWKVPAKPFAITTAQREVLHSVTEVVARGGSKYSVRSALTLSTGDWELIRNGESLWVTPEGLTGVVAATFIDDTHDEELAQDLAVEGQSNLVSAYIHRLGRHFKETKALPKWIKEQHQVLNAALRGEGASFQDVSYRRDNFGFSKTVIVATQKGRLAAIGTGSSGKVIWNIQAVTLAPGTSWDILGIDAEYGTALVRGAKGEFLRVNIHTGKILNHQKGELSKGLATIVAFADINGQQALLPVNADGSLGEVPNADFDSRSVLVTRRGDNELKGWSLSKKGGGQQIWRFGPFSGHRIIDVVHRPAHDPVASIGKALGDRNVLYKYLNPNLILVTTINEQAASATFYLIDSASGSILHSTSHPEVDLSQPISTTISENLLAYSLYSKIASQEPLSLEQPSLQGFQLVAAELFESPYPNDRGPLGPASNHSSIHPSTSLDEFTYTPRVISQTFLIPGPISHISVTSTLQGITPRSLLCVTPHSNALISIPRQFLDPRRPIGRDPTTNEMEEGLFRYSSYLDFEPKWSLNHKRDFLGLSQVITTPSLLESTSLVFAFGDTDLFGTRSSPIGGFDMLGKGFSKLQLVGTVAVLALGTGVLAPLVRKKQIDGIWKA